MQIKTGIDIIEVNRIKEAIQDLDEKFLKGYIQIMKLSIVTLKII